MYITTFDCFNLSNKSSLINEENQCDPVHQYEEAKSNELLFLSSEDEDLSFLRASYNSQDGSQGSQGYEKSSPMEDYLSNMDLGGSYESINRRCLRMIFERWRKKLQLKLQAETETEKEYGKEILSREYYRSKAKYKLQQKNSIASVHFKIGILSDSFHKWRLFTIAMHVKRRRQEVARVHYGDYITGHYFDHWKEVLKERHCQESKVNIFIMARTLKMWRGWTCLSKKCNNRQYKIAFAYRNLVILRSAFVRWKEDVMFMKAETHHETRRITQVFKVWSLQLLKRKLQRRISWSYRRRMMQVCFFTKWKGKKDCRVKARALFSSKLELFVLRYYWERLKKGVEEETLTRLSASLIDSMCKKNFAHHYFSLWKQKYKVECFKIHIEKRHGQYILQMHFTRWKKQRKKLLLYRKIKLWYSIQGKLILIQFFSCWQHQKQKRLQTNKEYECYIALLDQSKLARSFSTWKHRSNEECGIKILVRESEIRLVKRCFNLWILVKRRSELLKMQKVNILSRTFSNWREGTEQKVDVRRRKIERDTYILQKSVSKWKDYAALSKQCRETSTTSFARHWLGVTQKRATSRKIAKIEKVSCAVIKKVHFVKWNQEYDAAVRRRQTMEGIADQHHQTVVCLKVLNRWARQQSITTMVRNYQQEKATILLGSSFKHWSSVVQQDMQSLINSFTEKLTLDQNVLQTSVSTSTLVNDRNVSPQLKTNDLLVNLYKESIESSSLQESDILPQESENKSTLRTNEFGSSSSLTHAQKTEPSDFMSTSLPFTMSDTNNDFSLNAYNRELDDYNTDNDVDQDQIWEEPVSRSQLQLNFSSFSNATSDDNSFIQTNSSFQPANISTDDTNSPKWIYMWKKRYIYSKTLSQQKRFLHNDVISPNVSSSLPALGRTMQNHRHIQLPLPTEDGAMQSRTIDNRKVSLLVSTLTYWIHLDISVIFYAWLSYTQRKKFLRLMQEYLLEKKRHYHIHVIFLEWNRKLYGERVSGYFREKTVKGEYLFLWMKYHRFQQRKLSWIRNAEEHCRKSLVKTYFKRWKKKCHLEFLLSGVNNSWNEDGEMALVNAIALREKQVIESSFQAWKCSSLKMKLSKIHHEKILQKKCLGRWHRFVLDKDHVREKLKIFCRDHQLKRFFFQWKRKMHCKIQICQAEKTKENGMKVLVFSEWHKWTRLRLDGRLKVNIFKHKSNFQLLFDAFKEWEVSYRQTKRAIEHCSYVTYKCVFSAWFHVSGQMVINENKVRALRSKSLSHLISRMFVTWRHMYESRLKADNTNKQKEGNTLSITFKAWKETTLDSKADRQYVDSRCKHIFKSWKEKYVSRNEIQFLAKISCRRWKRLVQKTKANEVFLEQYLEKKNLFIKKHYLVKWRQSFQEHMVSKHCEKIVQLVRKIAMHWKLKTKKHIFSSKREHSLLQNNFLLWSQKYYQLRKAIEVDKRNTMRHALLHWVCYSRRLKEIKSKACECVQVQENQLIHTVFLKWRDMAEQIQAQRHAHTQQQIAVNYYNHYLMKSLFYQWEVFVRLEKIKRTRQERLACKYFRKWRNTILAGNAIIDMFHQNMFEKYWKKWRNAYIQSHVLKVMEQRDDKRLLSLAFASWCRHAHLKSFLPNRMKVIRTEIWFCKWKERVAVSSHSCRKTSGELI